LDVLLSIPRAKNLKYKVIYMGGIEGFEAARVELADTAEVIQVEANTDCLNAYIGVADAVIDASMKVKIDNAMVDSAPRLKVISCATTGSDHIDRESVDARGINVNTLKEDRELLQNLTPAAELSWALLMACARKLPQALKHVKSGEWVRECFPGTMLNGKQLGLIGFGRIGGWMARYGQAFGMTVVCNDPYAESIPDFVQSVSLERLMESSDFISVHVHLSDDTRDLVNEGLLCEVKEGAVLINTSRGDIISQNGLLKVLESGRLGAAGLDVIQGEPDIDQNPLVQYAREHDNLLITPHIGGFSPDAVTVVCKRAAEKVRKVLGESK